MSERAKHSITLEHLFAEWEKFVKEVEDGYELTIYDYTNDLTIRGLIQEIIEGVPHAGDAIEKAVQGLDERFTEATHPEPSMARWARRVSWLDRLPKKLVDELAEDVNEGNAH